MTFYPCTGYLFRDMTISVPTSNRFEILLLLNIIMLKILTAMLHVAIGNPNLGSPALERDKKKNDSKKGSNPVDLA